MKFSAQNFRPEIIARVRPHVDAYARRTPLVPSPWLSERAGVDVYLKCENLQVTGAFKVRGALAALSRLEGANPGVITSSTGNHGTALAYAARLLEVACTVVVPAATPGNKRDKIQGYGADLVESPVAGYDATQAWTLELARQTGRIFVSPFEDPWVAAGNGGTTGLEILEDLPATAEILTPVGGGGLALGLAQALDTAGSSARLTGVNARACPGMALSLDKNEAQVVMPGKTTLADAIEGGVGAMNFQLLRERLHGVEVVAEETIAAAVRGLVVNDHLITEGAGAAAAAAVLSGYQPLGPCVVLVSGGNIDPDQLIAILGGG